MTEVSYQKSQSTFSTLDLLTGFLVVGMIGGGALEVSTSEETLSPYSAYTLTAVGDTPYSVQVTKTSSEVITNKEFESTMTNFYSTLLAGQEELGSEFEKVLYQNLSSLYES